MNEIKFNYSEVILCNLSVYNNVISRKKWNDVHLLHETVMRWLCSSSIDNSKHVYILNSIETFHSCIYSSYICSFPFPHIVYCRLKSTRCDVLIFFVLTCKLLLNCLKTWSGNSSNKKLKAKLYLTLFRYINCKKNYFNYNLSLSLTPRATPWSFKNQFRYTKRCKYNHFENREMKRKKRFVNANRC